MTLDTAIDEGKEKGKLTFSQISAGMESRQVPMVSQILRIINDISGRAESLSVNDLAEFIGSEPTTLGRIISIASSVGYNATGMEITSVHHAISVIGFDRIRTLAVSILLFESAQSETMAATNRELAGEALISGLVAAEVCRRGAPADPEVAFICGVMREYGRMLAATFLPQDYAEAVRLGSQVGAGPAFKSVFGISSLDLGRQLLEGMLVPKLILNSFVSLPSHARRNAPSNAALALITVADFGQRTAELLQSPGLSSDNFERRLENLSREYDATFLLTGTAARELLDQLLGVISCFRGRASSYAGSVGIFRRLDCLATQRALPPTLAPVFEPATVAPRRLPEVVEPEFYDI